MDDVIVIDDIDEDKTDPAEEAWAWVIEDDAGKKTTYGNYLNLDSILNSNHMHSSVHDEHLFISVHQGRV